MLQVTISGSYKTADRDVVDFENVIGIVPDNDEEIVAMHVRGRHAAMWIAAEKDDEGDKKYERRVHSVRECFIDDITPVKGKPSYDGKDIKQMSYEELQDLALGKDLRGIPLFKKASLRTTRERAYIEYSDKVLGKRIDNRASDFNFAKLPALIVDDAPRKETEGKISNETLIEIEQNSTGDPRETMTLEELKKVADAANIKYSPRIGREALLKKVLGTAQATSEAEAA